MLRSFDIPVTTADGGSLDDLAERLAAAEEALATAQAALARRDEMIAAAAHDLRTPIYALQMHFARMKKVIEVNRTDLGGSAEFRARLDSISSLNENLAQMVNVLFDRARLKSDSQPLKPEICDLSLLVRDSVAILEDEIARSGSAVTTILAPHSTGWWDPIHIQRVIVNIISNALKYGGENPIEIVVAADTVRTSLQVRDSGSGIAETDQERIFRRYERARPRDDMKSMGIGLHIAREIVEMHGGVLRVMSIPGQGSNFEVCLPRGRVETLPEASTFA